MKCRVRLAFGTYSVGTHLDLNGLLFDYLKTRGLVEAIPDDPVLPEHEEHEEEEPVEGPQLGETEEAIEKGGTGKIKRKPKK